MEDGILAFTRNNNVSLFFFSFFFSLFRPYSAIYSRTVSRTISRAFQDYCSKQGRPFRENRFCGVSRPLTEPTIDPPIPRNVNRSSEQRHSGLFRENEAAAATTLSRLFPLIPSPLILIDIFFSTVPSLWSLFITAKPAIKTTLDTMVGPVDGNETPIEISK